MNAVISDFGFYLDDDWSESQLNVVSHCICDACDQIGERDSIPAAEIESWEILDDLRIFARGLDVVRTRPIVEFGRGLNALLDASLPAAPPGTWWFYGVDDSPSTIKKRT